VNFYSELFVVKEPRIFDTGRLTFWSYWSCLVTLLTLSRWLMNSAAYSGSYEIWFQSCSYTTAH